MHAEMLFENELEPCGVRQRKPERDAEYKQQSEEDLQSGRAIACHRTPVGGLIGVVKRNIAQYKLLYEVLFEILRKLATFIFIFIFIFLFFTPSACFKPRL